MFIVYVFIDNTKSCCSYCIFYTVEILENWNYCFANIVNILHLSSFLQMETCRFGKYKSQYLVLVFRAQTITLQMLPQKLSLLLGPNDRQQQVQVSLDKMFLDLSALSAWDQLNGQASHLHIKLHGRLIGRDELTRLGCTKRLICS